MCARAQRELLGLRLTRLYAVGIGISYAILTYGLAPDSRLATGMWARCLTTASWVAGVGALSLARDLTARDDAQGLASLVRLRGFGEPALERARTAAGALRLITAIATPGLLVALSALLRFRNWSGASTALLLALLTLPYAALLGSVLSISARLCARWLPARGRLLLAALTLGPWLLALGTKSPIPSIPGAFGWLLAQLAGSVE